MVARLCIVTGGFAPQQVHHPVDVGHRVGPVRRAARGPGCGCRKNVRSTRAVGEKSARAGLRTAGDEDFGFRDGVVADFSASAILVVTGPETTTPSGMARQAVKTDAEAAEVEIDVARG